MQLRITSGLLVRILTISQSGIVSIRLRIGSTIKKDITLIKKYPLIRVPGN